MSAVYCVYDYFPSVLSIIFNILLERWGVIRVLVLDGVIRAFIQLLPRPNARMRQLPRNANWAPTSLSVTSMVSTRPCSAGTPPASAGVWTALARPSKTPPCEDNRNVRKVKHGDRDLFCLRPSWLEGVTGFPFVYFSSLSWPNDDHPPEGAGRHEVQWWVSTSG